MNILHINTQRSWRGGERQVLYLMNGLKQYSVNQFLYCRSHSPVAEKALASELPVLCSLYQS